MIAFLLQLASQAISVCPVSQIRVSIMKKVSQRILSSFLSLDDVLVHPFRLRYRILRLVGDQIVNTYYYYSYYWLCVKSRCGQIPDMIPIDS